MRPRLLLSLVAIVLIGILTVVVVATTLPSPTRPPSSAGPTGGPSPSLGTQPGGTAAVTYPDFIADRDIIKAPTASSAQSKLWYAQGSWWGVLFAPTSDRLDIYRLDPTTQVWADTGSLVEERLAARSDVLWDGTHLYVASGGSRPSPSHAIRMRRFSYDESGKRYVLDPGFPTTINPTGGSPVVITKDSTGVVWATFAVDGRVWVSHTLDHDAHWSKPAALPPKEAVVDPTDVSAIVAFGPGKVGLVWTNQLQGAVYASIHDDGTPDDAWSPPEIVESGGGVDNEISVAAIPQAGGTGSALATTVSTALDQGGAVRQLDPLTLLAIRDASGTWTTNLIGLVRDHHARPVIMVDPAARTVYVAATSPGNGGTVFYKRASLDTLEFDTGRGTPLISSTTDVEIDDVTSTKGPISKESGLVALAVDRSTGRYSHVVLDIGGGPPTADPADPKRPTTPTPAPAKTTTSLLRDDFEAWAVGRADAGWYVRPDDPQGRLSIIDGGPLKHALRVPSARGGVRACRDFPLVPGARVTVTARVRVSAISASDGVLLSARGSGGEAGSVRITSRGVFGWYVGATKVRSLTVVRRGSTAWYRISMTFDQARRTYEFHVWNAANKPVAGRSGLRWRTKGVTAIDSICIDTAAGPRPQVIDIGEVSVQVPVS
jgi:hypothetical protein